MNSIAHCGCVCEVMERLFGTKIVWKGDMHATNGEGYCSFLSPGLIGMELRKEFFKL